MKNETKHGHSPHHPTCLSACICAQFSACACGTLSALQPETLPSTPGTRLQPGLLLRDPVFPTCLCSPPQHPPRYFPWSPTSFFAPLCASLPVASILSSHCSGASMRLTVYPLPALSVTRLLDALCLPSWSPPPPWPRPLLCPATLSDLPVLLA